MLNHTSARSLIHKTEFKSSQQAGQSLIEFALVLGLIIVIFLGAVDIFNLLQQKADLDKMVLQAARQAGEFGGAGDNDEVKAYLRAQMAALGYTGTDVEAALNNSSTFNLKAHKYESNAIVLITPEVSECKYGEFISVYLEVPWDTNIPGVLFFNEFNGAGTFKISSTARCWRA